jgi:hypothetical protein
VENDSRDLGENKMRIKDWGRKLAHRLGYEIQWMGGPPWPANPVLLDLEWIWDFVYLSRHFERIRGVPGDVVECGVYRGRSLVMLASLVWGEGRSPWSNPYDAAANPVPERLVWGFDSFQGFPQPTAEDLASPGPGIRRGRYAGYAPDTVRRALRGRGLSEKFTTSTVRLVPGYFEDTLPSFARPLAFIHVHCDLASSHRTVLQWLYPHVVPGGVILLPCYGSPSLPTTTSAIDEFFADRPEQVQADPHSGLSFVVKAGGDRLGGDVERDRATLRA